MEVAGDADVFALAVGEGFALGLVQLLLQDVGRGVVVGEGDGVGAELGFGVVEDGAVDEVGS